MLCKLCHLERACKKKRKKNAAPTITATFRGQIRASENTRDSPETRARFCRVLKGPALIDVGGAAAPLTASQAAAIIETTTSLETKTDSDVKPCSMGETRVLPVLLCEWPGVDKSGS